MVGTRIGSFDPRRIKLWVWIISGVKRIDDEKFAGESDFHFVLQK